MKLSVAFLVSLFALAANAQVPAPSDECPKDPTAVVQHISDKFIYEKAVTIGWSAELTFVSGNKRDIVTRHSTEQGVRYDHDKLNLNGSGYQIKHDSSMPAEERRKLDLNTINYFFAFDKERSSDTIYTYAIFPKGEAKGRFYPNSTVTVDRSRCEIVRATGRIYSPMFTVNVDSTFQQIKGLTFPASVNVTMGRLWGDYHLNVTYKIDQGSIQLRNQ